MEVIVSTLLCQCGFNLEPSLLLLVVWFLLTGLSKRGLLLAPSPSPEFSGSMRC